MPQRHILAYQKMPTSCCVIGCTQRQISGSSVRFFRIPANPERRLKWLKVIKRTQIDKDGKPNHSKLWQPHSASYVCGKHFVTGSKNDNEEHVDFVPSIFPHLSKKQDTSNLLDARSERRKKRREIKVEAVSNATTVNKAESTKQHENNQLVMEVQCLRRERDIAQQNLKAHLSDSMKKGLSTRVCEGNDTACKTLTGISWQAFVDLWDVLCLESTILEDRQAILPPKEQLFLTLVKLRQNPTFDMLSFSVGVQKERLIKYFRKWISLVYNKMSFMISWPEREGIYDIIPPLFKDKFPKLTCIIDCFEIFIDAPRNLLARAQTFSSYKKHCTVKCLIACNPVGAIFFLSKCYGGRASDKFIIDDSGFVDPKYHSPGDQILADRGFTMKDEIMAKCSAELITPAFKKGQKQMRPEQIELSRKISSVRIHIERVIGLLKNRYTILKGVVPLRCVQSLRDEALESDLSSFDQIIGVCSILVNIGDSIV